MEEGCDQNPTGLSPRNLVDVQKLLACGKVANVAEDVILCDMQKVHEMKLVAALATSARVNLLFRAPGTLRTLMLR